VNPLRALLTALTPEIEEHDTRMRAVGTALKALRADLRSLHRDAAAVAARAEAVSRQVAQLRRLRDAGDAAAVLDELAEVLTADRVASQLRTAVERAPRHDEPIPRLRIAAPWPDDVYQVLTTRIPDPIFFDVAGPGTHTLRVPPRLAPVSAIAVWTLVASLIEHVVVPAVAARFGDRMPAPLDVTPGRLVRRAPGSAPPPVMAKAWQRGRLVLDLNPPGSNTANTAVVTVGSADPLESGECTYEVWFGPKPA